MQGKHKRRGLQKVQASLGLVEVEVLHHVPTQLLPVLGLCEQICALILEELLFELGLVDVADA